MGVQMSIFDLDSLFGKTSQELSQVTEGKILEPSWKNFVESKKTTFQFLCLTTESGRIAEQSQVMASLLRGDLWIVNTSEYLNVEKGSPSLWTTEGTTQRTYYYRESRLSEILQTDASEKYYLSAKACEGILRRADKRGKELPEVLKTALENQITRTPSKSGGGSDTYIKPDGSIGTAGKGALIQTEQSATLGVSQDQTLFTPTPINTMVASRTTDEKRTTFGIGKPGDPQFSITSAHEHAVAYGFEPGISKRGNVESRISEEKTPTLRAKMGDNQIATAYGLGRDSFNSGENAKFSMSIEEETQPPITERGAGGVCSITQ